MTPANGDGNGNGNGQAHEHEHETAEETKNRLARWMEAAKKGEEKFPEGVDPSRTQVLSTFEPTTAIGNPKSRVTSRDAPRPKGEAVLVRMSDVEPEEVEWLWGGRIPMGMPTLIFGDGGKGKSQLTVSLAAIVSSGGRWPDRPDEPVRPGSVVFLQAEDSLAVTLRPRLDAAGADSSKVHALTGIRDPEGNDLPFKLTMDCDALEAAIARIGDVRLIVIDPVTEYLDGADEHKNAETRAALKPVIRMVERLGIALVLITHVNKGSGAKAMNRISGSIAFRNVARMTWFVCEDPEDQDRRYFAPDKSNIAARAPALAFSVEGRTLVWEREPIPDLSADRILQRERQVLMREEADGARGPIPRKMKACIDWLAERLVDGPKAQKDLLTSAKESKFSTCTFYDSVSRGPFTRSKGDDDLTMIALRGRLPLEYGDGPDGEGSGGGA